MNITMTHNGKTSTVVVRKNEDGSQDLWENGVMFHELPISDRSKMIRFYTPRRHRDNGLPPILPQLTKTGDESSD